MYTIISRESLWLHAYTPHIYVVCSIVQPIYIYHTIVGIWALFSYLYVICIVIKLYAIKLVAQNEIQLNFIFPHIRPYRINDNINGKTILGAPIRPIVVIEDSFLRLRCAASGEPKPHVEWHRLDGRPITDGAWQCKYLYFEFEMESIKVKITFSKIMCNWMHIRHSFSDYYIIIVCCCILTNHLCVHIFNENQSNPNQGVHCKYYPEEVAAFSLNLKMKKIICVMCIINW